MSAPQSTLYPYPSQRVVVLRHGERRDSHPDAPAETNPPLTEAGVAAVETTAARLKRYLGADAARDAVLVVSPFLRTVQTAEALQHHGIGSEHAMVVDNTLCEVFGPSRIKTSRAPQLQTSSASRTVGGLPTWGESIETATERYVTNFLRNGDVYSGWLSAGSTLSDPSFSTVLDSQTSSSLVCPPAVTSRQHNTAGSAAMGAEKAGVPAALSPNTAESVHAGTNTPDNRGSQLNSSTNNGEPHDVILVTHGDAISAILSYFYPARIVYEADFLSFMIMRRYGVGNHVYHLDESAGVNWFTEGIDSEPKDLILNALEAERAAAMTAAEAERAGNGTANHSGSGPNEDDSDELDESDDEGEALDEEAENQPSSIAGSRMRSRISARPAPKPAASIHPHPQPHPSHSEHPAHAIRTQARRPTHATGGGSEDKAVAEARAAHTPSSTSPVPASHTRRTAAGNGDTVPTASRLSRSSTHGTAATTARNYPKAGEDCERIRLPTGTPAQSSMHPASMKGDETPSCRLGQPTSPAHQSDHSSNDDPDGSRASSEVQKPQETVNRPIRTSTAAKDVADEEMMSQIYDAVGLTSSCGGLTEDPSSSSWAKRHTSSWLCPSTIATRGGTVTGSTVVRPIPSVVADPEVVEGEKVTNVPRKSPAERVLNEAPTWTATAPPPVASGVTAELVSRQHSVAASPVASAEYVASNDLHGIPSPRPDSTSTAHCESDASWTPPDTTNTPLVTPTCVIGTGSEGLDGAEENNMSSSTVRLHQTVLRSAIAKAHSTSCMIRLTTVCVIVVTELIFYFSGSARRTALPFVVWAFCAVMWEVVFTVVLMLSCKGPQQRRARQIRRAVEQLRCAPMHRGDAAVSATGTTRPPTDRHVHDPGDGHGEFHGMPRDDTHHETATAWAAEHPQEIVGHTSPDFLPPSSHGRRTSVTRQMLLRHVAAAALKILVLWCLALLLDLAVSRQALHGLGLAELSLTTPLGWIFWPFYICANIARGVWDETTLDPLLGEA